MTGPTERDPWATAVENAFRDARAAGLSIGAAADIVVAVLREKLAEAAEEEVTSPDDVVRTQSILSAASGGPLVQVMCGPLRWQWDPATTRKFALELLATAEAADQDAMTFRWMTLGQPDLPPEAAITALADLRRFRGDPDRETWQEHG